MPNTAPPSAPSRSPASVPSPTPQSITKKKPTRVGTVKIRTSRVQITKQTKPKRGPRTPTAPAPSAPVRKKLWPLPPTWVWTVLMSIGLILLCIWLGLRDKNQTTSGDIPAPTPVVTQQATPQVPLQPQVPVAAVPAPLQAPAPTIPTILNVTQVNVENSPGANVNTTVSTAGGNSQQQAYIGGDWKKEPPTRRVDLGNQPSDILQPGDNVQYDIPRGTTVTPMPVDDSIPPGAVEWVPVQPWGYQILEDNWNCGSIRMRISPQWRGGSIRMEFNRRPEGQPLQRGYHGGQPGGGFQGGYRGERSEGGRGNGRR